MRQLMLTTASAIALGAGLTFAGTTQAIAWSHHAAKHSSATQMPRTKSAQFNKSSRPIIFTMGKSTACSGPRPGGPSRSTRGRTACV